MLRVVIRLLDQGLWSVGFFMFNILASIVLDVDEFAALAVCTSISFVMIAMVRSAAINARLVAGARIGLAPELTLSPRAMLVYSISGAVVAAVICGAWLALGPGTTVTVGLLAITVALVVSDAPHQLLIFGSKYIQAGLLALGYALLAGAALTTGAFLSANWLTLYWCGAGLVLCVAGWILVSGNMPTYAASIDVRKYAWRLSAEALYVGVAGQLAILMLYLLDDSEAAAGFRLGYALVFAPAFMIIQGISPLYVKSLARNIEARRLIRKAAVWSLFVSILIAACGIGSIVVGQIFPGYSALGLAVNYLAPVGISVLAGQILEGATSACRFSVSPEYLHRFRLVVVGIDLACQVFAVICFGVEGLVYAVIVIGFAKLLLTVGLLTALRRART